MARLDPSNTIVVIKPLDPTSAELLDCEQNKDRLKHVHYHEPLSTLLWEDDPTTRECTPYAPPRPEIEFHLGFDPEPKDYTRGFVFGSDSRICDVVLKSGLDDDPKKRSGISRQHFLLDFNWDTGVVLIQNLSQYGTGVLAPSADNGYEMFKHEKRRMLISSEQTKIYAGSAQFEIRFPPRNESQQQLYSKNWEAFRNKHMKAAPTLSRLHFQSTPQRTPFVARRQGRNHTYQLQDPIGGGNFGVVCKATDYGTGSVFAAKEFKSNTPDWKDRARKEVALSLKMRHENVLNFTDSIDDEIGIVLIMEYVPMGNLMQAHEQVPFSRVEATVLCLQILRAVLYLHEEMKTTHRDIKPTNILVSSRAPGLSIKICDFGVSTLKIVQETVCGTRVYAAPEIYTQHYTNAVDIWATAVVVLEIIDGLPAYDEQESHQTWHDALRRRAGAAKLVLLERMLQLKPDKRPSARICLADSSALSLTYPTSAGVTMDEHQNNIVTSVDDDIVRLIVNDYAVHMRKHDSMVNATQMMNLAQVTTKNQRDNLRRRLKNTTGAIVLPQQGGGRGRDVWISVENGIVLCAQLGLAESLQPLIIQGLDLQRDVADTAHVNQAKTFINPPVKSTEYMEIKMSSVVMIRKSDMRVNAAHIARLSGFRDPRSLVQRLRAELPSDTYDIVRGTPRYQGTYITLKNAIGLCDQLKLSELKRRLFDLTPPVSGMIPYQGHDERFGKAQVGATMYPPQETSHSHGSVEGPGRLYSVSRSQLSHLSEVQVDSLGPHHSDFDRESTCSTYRLNAREEAADEGL